MAQTIHTSQLPCTIIEPAQINRRAISGGVLTERTM